MPSWVIAVASGTRVGGVSLVPAPTASSADGGTLVAALTAAAAELVDAAAGSSSPPPSPATLATTSPVRTRATAAMDATAIRSRRRRSAWARSAASSAARRCRSAAFLDLADFVAGVRLLMGALQRSPDQ